MMAVVDAIIRSAVKIGARPATSAFARFRSRRAATAGVSTSGGSGGMSVRRRALSPLVGVRGIDLGACLIIPTNPPI